MGDIRITMLGYTKSGKTCYMLGMYNTMQLGINAFTILAKQVDVMNTFEERWDQLTTEVGNARWPRPTNISEEYEFVLSHALRPVISFDWFDYRGGFLDDDESKEDLSGDNARQLRQKIDESDCIFLCVSGEHLKEKSLDEATLRKRIRANRINFYLQPYIEARSKVTDQPIPVAIVITKFDHCLNAGITPEMIYPRIKQYFNPFFDRGFVTAICPVTLGTQLTVGNDLNQSLGMGQIAPKHMHLPVLFATWASFRQVVVERGLSALTENQLVYYRKLENELRSGNMRVFVEGAQQI